MLQAWQKWLANRDPYWPEYESNILTSIPAEPRTIDLDYIGIADSVNPYDDIVGFTSSFGNVTLKTWICDEKSGGKCNGFANNREDAICRLCGSKSQKWKCTYCTTRNNACNLSCCACFVLKTDSEKLSRDREVAEAIRIQKVESSRQSAARKELEALFV